MSFPWIRWSGPLAALAVSTLSLFADDWPQWMGPGRDGVWRETGIVENLSTNPPPVKWKVPVNAGYVGPAVVGNRLFLMDRKAGTAGPRKAGERASGEVPGNERNVCLDTTTGPRVGAAAERTAGPVGCPRGARQAQACGKGGWGGSADGQAAGTCANGAAAAGAHSMWRPPARQHGAAV